MIEEKVAQLVAELIAEVDADIIAELRRSPWDMRKELLNQLDVLRSIEERLHARRTATD